MRFFCFQLAKEEAAKNICCENEPSPVLIFSYGHGHGYTCKPPNTAVLIVMPQGSLLIQVGSVEGNV
ncbi:hypothetical protein V6N13_137297 [Hibiscus sabdariffa]